MSKIVVTTGQPFTDIDALACAIAYTELLKMEGNDVQCVLPGPLNKSITETVKKWGLKFSIKPILENPSYVLVDISEPKFFANFVTEGDISEIYDHRYGFESYWEKKLGKNSHIEMVGSCATLIWEEIIKRKTPGNLANVYANLLYTAIVSNTLNFQASVTTSRDTRAANEIFGYTELPKNWIKKYFKDQDKEVVKNIKEAIVNDTKDVEPTIAQLELWDSKPILYNHKKEIEEAILSFNKKEWFLTSPCISESKNYFFTKQKHIKNLLSKTINVKFEGDFGTTDKLWLRKEILRKLNKSVF